jgi:nitroimidazol reductase NimA-like FMN-containing flavoprotein (pyridoxamine 5'-phosphate oxidase superfamily)
MRRKELEITDPSKIESIIKQGQVCRIAFHDDKFPYILPVCYGFLPGYIFFHSAPEGKKIVLIKKNPKVCFEFETETRIINSEKVCG